MRSSQKSFKDRRIAVSEQKQASALLAYEDKDKKEPVWLQGQKCLMGMEYMEGKWYEWPVVYGTFLLAHTYIFSSSIPVHCSPGIYFPSRDEFILCRNWPQGRDFCIFAFGNPTQNNYLLPPM